MLLIRPAVAGTLESSDAFVEVAPAEHELIISIDSAVYAQYGDSIEKSVRDVLEQFLVKSGQITVTDRGALDCTIRARVETALNRAAKEM